MISPNDAEAPSLDEREILRHDEELRGTLHAGHETLGRFEPQGAQRNSSHLGSTLKCNIR
jgi:hypothetical protein